MGEGGIRVVPPFQEPFYHFEEAVSTGVPQLDRLLGGGIPYGGFYLMEIDADLHQDIFDASFAKEALEAGDHYLRLAGQSDERSRWYALMKAAGMADLLQQGLASGKVKLTVLDDLGSDAGDPSFTSELNHLCATDRSTPIRVQVDVSRLFSHLSPDRGHASLMGITRCCQGTKVVALGVASPRSIPGEHLEKLRAAADGIVRVWTEGGHPYLQVVKTVNSARTPVYAVNPIPKPPFVEIMTD
jgi:archaellum biogenesis ATPase FlaH